MKYIILPVLLLALLSFISCKKKKETTTPKVTSQCYFDIDTTYTEPVGACNLIITHETPNLSVLMSRNNDLLLMSLSDQIAVGSYTLDNTDEIMFMMYQPHVTADPYVAVSANLNITEHNFAQHSFSGTVDMILVDDASQTDTLIVTNGSFTGSY